MADEDACTEQELLDHIDYFFRTQMSMPRLDVSVRTPGAARAAVAECDRILELLRSRRRTIEALMKAATPYVTQPTPRRR
jgi:beta-xylosidase